MFQDQYTQWCNQIHAPAQLVEKTCAACAKAPQPKKSFWKIKGAAPAVLGVACALLVALCLPLVRFLPQNLPQQAAVQPQTQPQSQDTAPEEGIQIQTPLQDGQIAPKVELSDGVLYFVKSDGMGDVASRLYFGEDTTEEKWDENQVLEYLGHAFLPTKIPQGLTPQQREGHTQTVVYNAQGELVHDTFYYQWQDNENPEEYVPDRAQLRIEVAKNKIPSQCGLYQFQQENRSYVEDTPVFIGYLMNDFGPYDPVTHQPSGEYPLFVAQFVYNGVGYHIEGHNLTQRQFITTLLSVF